MHVLLKFVSFVWIHLKQHNYTTLAISFFSSSQESTYLLITLLLPLRDQHRIRISILQQPVIQLLADGLLLVVQIVDVATPLMCDLKDLPLCLMFWARRCGLVLCVFHLVGENKEVVLDVAKALWRGFALRCVADGGHVERREVRSVLEE